MAFFNIRSSRINLEIPVKIFLMERKTGTVSRECLQGVLVNFSKGGACVVVTKIMIEGDHAFFSTQDLKPFYLFIPDFLTGDHKTYDLTGVSIWMDGCTFQEQHSFKISMEFLQKQKELYNLLRKNKW